MFLMEDPNSYIVYWVSQWDPNSTDPVEDLWCNMYGCIQAFASLGSYGQDDEDHASALLFEVSQHIPECDPMESPRLCAYLRRAEEEEEEYNLSREYYRRLPYGETA